MSSSDRAVAMQSESVGAGAALRADWAQYYRLCEGSRVRRLFDCMRAPGIHAVTVLRFGQWAAKQVMPLRWLLTPIYMVLNELIKILWGIDIPRSARIGPGFYIGHFSGIFVSAHAVIGRNCFISQGVTIGVGGSGDKRGVPVLGDNVYLGAGCKLFGRITVGDGVKVGANAVVHCSLAEGAKVAAPGFIYLSGTAPLDNTAPQNKDTHDSAAKSNHTEMPILIRKHSK
ncbi:serine acetyltransferase [Sulfuriferula multivorans]|uniref:Serine acetyltransferase n=1 Tax=Sulfuriferula multivorans TaxID=1559896 RepID=A0A401JGW7_9PROT|nr:serine acetyltransferase [Sulfuriferula multivorans]GBL46833.1 serine acetyltransferase [Sulfuriferula multivorans]